MKKGCVLKSLFLAVGLMFVFLLVGVGFVTAGSFDDYDVYVNSQWWHINFYMEGSAYYCSGNTVSGGGVSFDCTRTPGYSCDKRDGRTYCYKLNSCHGVSGSWNYNDYFICYGGNVYTRYLYGWLCGGQIHYRWYQTATCSGTTASHCHDGYSSCQCDAVSGGWSAWNDGSNVGSCGSYQTCKQRRDFSRTCTNPSPSCGGTCSGSSSDTRYVDCGAVNGGWSGFSWSNVGSCGSYQACKQRQDGSRTCTNPSPSCSGAACSGSSSDTRYVDCGSVACTWNAWSGWSNVGSCGSYQACKQNQTRSRTSNAPSCSGAACSGPSIEYQSINCGDGTICRASTGPCDITAKCSSGSCPANAFNSSSTICRVSTDACDITEKCTGSSAACPVNSFNSSSTVCRLSTGPCDITEKCTGSSASCPANAFNSTDTICSILSPQYCAGADSNLLRINVTKCSGSAASCPSTPVVFNDTLCSDPTPFCSEGSCTSIGITEAYWSDLNGQPVSYANANDTLLMIIKGVGLSGKTIDYSILKTIWWFWASVVNNEDAIGFSSYKPEEGGTYKFKAKIQETSGEHASGNLEVYGGGGGGENNQLPVAILTAPINEINISNGINIAFNQSSYDEDDPLRIIWDFGDGTKKEITNYVNKSEALSGGSSDFNLTADAIHNYSKSGRYIVKLTAEEMTRGQKDSEERYVNVFSTGINVFPVISSPREGKIYESKTIIFNASESYVVNCSTASCPAGICFPVGNLNCSYLPSSGDSRNYNLHLTWSIVGDNSVKLPSGYWFNDPGFEKNMSVINFYHYFLTPKERAVKLVMEYIAGS